MFHICESGKKISFLCPNGTIFQQTELICDWWFKVNCAASPGHYAESSEVLSRAQNRTSSNKAKPVVNLHSNENRKRPSEEVANDNFDFEDISFPDLNAPKSNALNNDRKSKAYSQQPKNHQRSQNIQNVAQNAKNSQNAQNSQESQVFAASSSFVNAAQQLNNFNGYYYKQPNQNKALNQKESVTQTPLPQATSSVPLTTTAGASFTKNNNFNGYQYNEPDRNSRRLLTTRPSVELQKNSQGSFTATAAPPTTTTTAAPITYPNRGTTKYKNSAKQAPANAPINQFIINVADTTVRTTSPPLIRGRLNNEPTTFRYETTRTTPFYTPTVPSIVTSRPTTTRGRFQEARPTVSSVKVAEHAMEMMKTIQDLKLDNPAEPGGEKEFGDRSGLVIPPSSGPETLHSLALYFATAVDSLVTKPMVETTTPIPIPALNGLDVQLGNVTKVESSLVSDNTKRQYETLFGIDADGKNKANIRDGSSNSNEESNLSTNDLETEFSNNPIVAAAGTKQIRELAQVFTHALSAYLHDPSTFRKVLAEIRPTEPPPVTEYLNNRIGRNKVDFKDGTGATYLPTSATPSVRDANGVAPTTEDLEVLDFSDVTLSTPFAKDQATEINNGTDTSTVSPLVDLFDTTHSQILHDSLKHIDHVPASRILTEALESYALNQYSGNSLEGTTEPSNPLAIEINGGLEATTNFPYLEELENQNNTFRFPIKLTETEYPNAQTTEYPSSGSTSTGPLSFDLLPPSSVNKAFEFPKNDIPQPVDDNDLQRAQSQSIYGNKKNNLEQHRTGKEYTTKSKNDLKSLKNDNGHYITEITPTVTPSPELSKTTNPDNGKINPNTWSTLSYSVFLDPLTINDGLMSSNEQSTIVPTANTYLPNSSTASSVAESTEPTFPPYSQSTEYRQGKAITSTIGPPTHEDYLHVMQRKANEMFGSLNDTSADHLMNVMKKADKSKTVRKLILLLIQTCDDDYNKTVEQSRQALLTALIGMDGKIEDGNEIHTIRSKPYREEKALNLNGQSQNTLTTTTNLPITTYHRPLSLRIEQQQQQQQASYSTHVPAQQNAYYSETTTYSPLFQSTNYFSDTTSTPNYDYTTTTVYSTDADLTTTTYYQAPTTTTAIPTTRPPTTIKSRRRTTPAPVRNSKRLAKDLDQYLAHQGDTNYNVNQSHRNSDARALELLR